MVRDMQSREFNEKAAQMFNVDLFENNVATLPDTEEELVLHMQLNYKQAVELAEEQAINVLLEGNNFDLIKRRFYYDLTVCGIGAVKTNFNESEGVKIEYVDPANLVYSYSDSPYFEDLYYIGEVKYISINELIKEFPQLTMEELKELTEKSYSVNRGNYNKPYSTREQKDKNKVQILYFNYKTFNTEVYKIKNTNTGGLRAIEKDDTFTAESTEYFTVESRKIEVLYEGAIILGSDRLLKWNMCKNMMRPKSDHTKVKMNYAMCAPRMYNGKIESLVSRITGFADMIQLTHLKLQQVMSRIVPDGIYLDADGLAEIDLGNGTNYNPQEALNMFFQTGSVIGRSFTSDGDMNPGKVPIQEIQSGNGGAKMQSLIGTYNYYLQMIRDTTGLNEARDASVPDPKALVGVQKMAAANSNTATRHILQGGLFLTAEVCGNLSMRVSDILEYSPTRDAFIQKIGRHNVGTLDDVKDLHLYDFGIFLELSPDEEEKAMLENNIQIALSQQTIDLEDAIDLRNIKSLKLANQLLKVRRKKKMQNDQARAQQNMQAQAQANAQQQAAAAQAEVQKQQALTQTNIQLEQAKSNLKRESMLHEAEIKKQLMDHEFNINMRLRQVEVDAVKGREKEKEDRKDKRTKIQASQQSELIDQRKNEKPPKNFESSGNDILGGGMGLEAFNPR